MALALERPTALAHRVSAQVNLARAERGLRVPIEMAAAEAKRAIELEPNNADGHLALAQVLVHKGEHDAALDAVTTAKRLDPQNPQNYDRWGGQAQFLLGRFEDAALTQRQVIELNPEDMWSHLWLGVAYAELGREEEGRAEIVRLNAMRKDRLGKGPLSLNAVRLFDLIPRDAITLRSGLRLAGVRLLSAPPILRGDRLKGEDLRAIVRSPWWYGNNAGKGRDYWRFVNPEGKSGVSRGWALNFGFGGQ